MADWDKINSRGKVDDRRGVSPGMIGGSAAIVGLVLILATNFLAGGSTTDGLLQVIDQVILERGVSLNSNTNNQDLFSGEDDYEIFASKILGSNNDLWNSKIANYQEPNLVLFRQATQSGCGVATSDIGPHYCPADSTIYLDETFFDELTRRFGAKGGDVAEAYVISRSRAPHPEHYRSDATSQKIIKPKPKR